ncbi:Nif3-like dinuclear metal center hexameric protein [Marmoricola sp. URHB0036]|uniref:Nif3-like dinuclear metal center hexameric protein n=1 Tax=Marmoricola sp. URHB0036 TaxID=1298863 RepID=UPI000426233B|nr:Nif3-like dinuclear metal center hexameric protein [Marmoricola sp. URHB0036]
MPTLGDITALLDEWYPPQHADDWDAVGLVLGDPAHDVRRILLAVDPVTAVADEAILMDADLLVTHHPLFLKGVHGFAATDPKGRVAHRLTSNGCALFAAHTNADSPAGGVSESLALALGLEDVRPLEADPTPPLDKIVVFVPVDAAEQVRAALAAAGAGRVGDYDQASFSAPGLGRFRPLEGANPAIGEVGRPEVVEEVRIETVCPRHRRGSAVAAMVAAHPYEEPAYDVIELAPLDEPSRGSGRIGRLAAPMTLRDFAAHVDTALARTAHGVRVAGDPDQLVETVGLCGGAGDFLLDRARSAGVDVYLTSDLRHHPASELREHGAPALVDVAHWAAESTWLPVLRDRLVAALNDPGPGDTVEVRVSATNTDPWTFRV